MLKGLVFPSVINLLIRKVSYFKKLHGPVRSWVLVTVCVVFHVFTCCQHGCLVLWFSVPSPKNMIVNGLVALKLSLSMNMFERVCTIALAPHVGCIPTWCPVLPRLLPDPPLPCPGQYEFITYKILMRVICLREKKVVSPIVWVEIYIVCNVSNTITYP